MLANHLEKWWSSSMGRMTSHILSYMKWNIENVWNHQPEVNKKALRNCVGLAENSIILIIVCMVILWAVVLQIPCRYDQPIFNRDICHYNTRSIDMYWNSYHYWRETIQKHHVDQCHIICENGCAKSVFSGESEMDVVLLHLLSPFVIMVTTGVVRPRRHIILPRRHMA